MFCVLLGQQLLSQAGIIALTLNVLILSWLTVRGDCVAFVRIKHYINSWLTGASPRKKHFTGLEEAVV